MPQRITRTCLSDFKHCEYQLEYSSSSSYLYHTLSAFPLAFYDVASTFACWFFPWERSEYRDDWCEGGSKNSIRFLFWFHCELLAFLSSHFTSSAFPVSPIIRVSQNQISSKASHLPPNSTPSPLSLLQQLITISLHFAFVMRFPQVVGPSPRISQKSVS